MKEKENEKRQFERFSTHSSVWARPLDGTGDFQLLESVNISGGGLLFDLDHGLDENAELDIRFELPQTPDLIAVKARVIRSVKQAEDAYYIAVVFDEVINLNRSSLMAYLEAVYKP